MTSGKSPYLIRPATESDLSVMVGLLGELFAIEADFQCDPPKQERGLNLLLNRSGGQVWLAEQAGRAVGMCSVQVLISTAEGGSVGLIEDVVVTANARGNGVGRLLLQAVEDWAHEQGLLRLQLLADRTNGPALRFYKRMGWQETQMLGLRKILVDDQ